MSKNPHWEKFIDLFLDREEVIDDIRAIMYHNNAARHGDYIIRVPEEMEAKFKRLTKELYEHLGLGETHE